MHLNKFNCQDVLEQWRNSPQHMTWILSQMAKKKLLEKCQQVLKRVQTQGLEASMLGQGLGGHAGASK